MLTDHFRTVASGSFCLWGHLKLGIKKPNFEKLAPMIRTLLSRIIRMRDILNSSTKLSTFGKGLVVKDRRKRERKIISETKIRDEKIRDI